MSHNMGKQERINAIYCAVLQAAEPMTRLEICRAIGRVKSPHILDAIEELTAGGWLLKEVKDDPQFGRAYVYRIGKHPESNT
jgi:predicted transcriptional regulator